MRWRQMQCPSCAIGHSRQAHLARGRCGRAHRAGRLGGPPGYAEFLEAIADLDHERHDELTEWCDADFDPNDVNLVAIQERLGKLAKSWSRSKPKRPRKAA